MLEILVRGMWGQREREREGEAPLTPGGKLPTDTTRAVCLVVVLTGRVVNLMDRPVALCLAGLLLKLRDRDRPERR